jgi:hypothetical protein
MAKAQTCVICKQPFKGHGNFAAPVATGRCCDRCNATVVLPARKKEAKGKSK